MAELRVVGGIEHERKQRERELKKAGNAFLSLARKSLHERLRAGKLKPTDAVVWDTMADYPSASTGAYCWASQTTISEKSGVSPRAVGRAIKRLKKAKMLHVKQRGQGKSGLYILLNIGKKFQGLGDGGKIQPCQIGKARNAKLARLGMPNWQRSLSSKEPLHNNPPKPPRARKGSKRRPEAGSREDRQQRTTLALQHLNSHAFGTEAPQESEQDAFGEFWRAVSTQGDPGKAGPALAQWERLSAADQRAVLRLCGPVGLDLGGIYAATWLRARRWEAAPLRLPRPEGEPPVVEIVVALDPDSPDWHAERQRLIDAGERDAVRLMDDRARNGQTWSVKREVVP